MWLDHVSNERIDLNRQTPGVWPQGTATVTCKAFRPV
jgi:hypothetical protein